MRSYRVTNDQEGLRIDKWFKQNIANIPQSLIEKFLRHGKIKVDKKKIKSSKKVSANNTIYIFDLNLKNILHNKKINFPNKYVKSNENDVIYDNDDYLVVNKKSGISVQGGTKSKFNLVDIYKQSKLFDKTKPFPVHRIDKDTSGILIFAKNRKTAQYFTSLFRLRKIHKSYLSICHGEFKNTYGELNHNLERYENNKRITEKAITKFKVLDKNLGFSLVELKPITGRKHQLRKQTSLIGHPIVGDKKYSFDNKSKKNLMLHAHKIKFIINNVKTNFTADAPYHFRSFLNSKKLTI